MIKETAREENTPTEDKAIVRAWLLHLLADLEVYPDIEGKRTESGSYHVTIDLQFKS